MRVYSIYAIYIKLSLFIIFTMCFKDISNCIIIKMIYKSSPNNKVI